MTTSHILLRTVALTPINENLIILKLTFLPIAPRRQCDDLILIERELRLYGKISEGDLAVFTER